MKKSPSQIAKDIMYDHDEFSKWMGMEITHIAEGSSHVTMTVREEMTNGFKIAHGGITYSLADSAFAFACNSYGLQGVSIETSISHTAAVNIGDKLTAKAAMIQQSKRIGRYEVKVYNQKNVLVADFKGTCYYTGKEH